jgi:hypothetical protein
VIIIKNGIKTIAAVVQGTDTVENPVLGLPQTDVRLCVRVLGSCCILSISYIRFSFTSFLLCGKIFFLDMYVCVCVRA